VIGELVIVRPGAVLDADDNPVPGSGDPVELYAVVEPAGSTETVVRGRTGVFTTVRLYVDEPPADPIPRTCDVEIRGKTWWIEGEDADWRDPEGGDLGGIVITAYRAEG
jgi:hypothetical protein